MNPYSYPKIRHVRTQYPREYADYRAYKPYLQKEFSAKCVYCRQPDGMKGYESFGADHYKPKKLFPDLAATYSNLFYCCGPCNSRKGPFWPAAGALNRFIPNPCEHEMFEHLRFKHAQVVGRTPAGEFAVELLDLNSPANLNFRENNLELIELAEARIDLLTKHRNQLKAKRAAGSVAEDVFVSLMQKIDGQISISTSALGMLDGSIPAPRSRAKQVAGNAE